LLEKVGEAAAFGGLAVVASLFLPWMAALHSDRGLVLLGVILVGIVIAVLFRRELFRVIPTLPLLRRLLARPRPRSLWENLTHGSERLLGWQGLSLAIGLSFAARFCDGLVMLWAANVYGIDLPLAAAWFIVGSAGFVAGVSMLPGGVGVVEATTVTLLMLFGGEPAVAAATALTTRLLIFWIWIALGLVLAVRYCMSPWQESPGRLPS
jgi:uncharacterized membrane protein YbhN (UPF0104 family)